MVQINKLVRIPELVLQISGLNTIEFRQMSSSISLK